MSRAARRTPLTLTACLLGLVSVAVVGIFVYDHSQREQIAQGVRIDGIAVGGLSEAAATAKLQRRVVGSMERQVLVRLHSRTWSLRPREARVTVDVADTVAEAVKASRDGSIFARAWREATGGSVHRDVALRVSYAPASVRTFAARVSSAIDTAPRDATVKPQATGLRVIPGSAGVTVNDRLLGERVRQALRAPFGARVVTVPVHTVQPAVSTHDLASRYPAYIVVDRSKFQLRFYSHLKLASTYPIAVGMEGLETPAGLYHIQWEQVNPPWYVPKDAWAGALAGKTIPPGPEDPLKARFMAFDGGAGIHGIDPSEYGTIGHDASHGCVRMRIPDVIALYARSPVGTPVYVL